MTVSIDEFRRKFRSQETETKINSLGFTFCNIAQDKCGASGMVNTFADSK